MNLHRVSYVVFFLAVAITVEGSVSFQDRTVTLTCPNVDEDSDLKWKKDGKSINDQKQVTLSLSDYTDKNDGLYSCTSQESAEEKTHYFYIKAKVCDGCVDLDMTLALVVVFADVLLTLVIVLAVYYCTRKNAGTAGPQRPTQARQGRAQARGPPPPDPDYQPLNPTTRSGDVYATAHRR
ncbi:hypothetical protein KOW79_014911 [Hemibagrus wyckioides]|uniref:Ig-like domain-containing protein n=1 Tax=Hemibagrus wyckioides TaxID=337641 RepID=A0A9D3SJS3_9TELE|nr:T-cell surface glycoprotein CD3 epsilon chain-like [Hemibagrus wyckioides]KAG7322053.1 hypothetical protein KOW79_014911 [Hemibagrus wyckioides]